MNRPLFHTRAARFASKRADYKRLPLETDNKPVEGFVNGMIISAILWAVILFGVFAI